MYIHYIYIYKYSCVLHTNDVHDVEIDTEQNKDLQHVTLPSIPAFPEPMDDLWSISSSLSMRSEFRLGPFPTMDIIRLLSECPQLPRNWGFWATGVLYHKTLPLNDFKCHPGVYVYLHVRAVSLHPALYTNQRQMPRCISPRPFAAEGKQNHSSASAGCL